MSLQHIPFAGGLHAYVWKVVEYPQSTSFCQGLPGALETRVTFSEDMQRLFALIAMSASGGLRVMRLVVKGAFTLSCTEIPSDFPPSWWIRLTTSRAKKTRLHFPPSRPSFQLCRITQVLVPIVKEGLHIAKSVTSSFFFFQFFSGLKQDGSFRNFTSSESRFALTEANHPSLFRVQGAYNSYFCLPLSVFRLFRYFLQFFFAFFDQSFQFAGNSSPM